MEVVVGGGVRVGRGEAGWDGWDGWDRDAESFV